MEKSLDEIIAGKPSENKRQPRQRGRRGDRRNGPIKAGSERSRAGGSAVYITNVHPDIGEDDLRDLFRQAGPVLTVRVDRKENVAWVKFEYAADASVAQGRFNNRSAAGKIISVRQVENIGDRGSNSSSIQDRIGSGSGSKRGGRNRQRKERAKPKTAEDLDAELDSYMAVDTSAPASESAEAPKEPQQPAEGAAHEELMIE